MDHAHVFPFQWLLVTVGKVLSSLSSIHRAGELSLFLTHTLTPACMHACIHSFIHSLVNLLFCLFTCYFLILWRWQSPFSQGTTFALPSLFSCKLLLHRNSMISLMNLFKFNFLIQLTFHSQWTEVSPRAHFNPAVTMYLPCEPEQAT